MARNELSRAREHERAACDVGAEVTVAARDCARVVFASSVRGDDRPLPMRMVDLSARGCALVGRSFLPTGCAVGVVVHGDGARQMLGTVTRVTMVDQTPRYRFGVAFAPEFSLEAIEIEALSRVGREGAP